MCDTIVALGNATLDGSVIFAKNSDREPNEAHHLVLVPACDYPAGSQVQCTYVSIPQVEHTHAVLLAKPFWIWGAEMGANEHGVVIGNEAVFTRVPYDKTPGLIGMDFLRLALERAANAFDALEVITQLLEQYGQAGNCGFSHPFFYHNSFIIADRKEAWVLETAGRQWAAEKVESIRSISNAITIGKHWDLASPGLVDYALEKGWCKRREDFDFAACYSDPLYTRFADARKRQSCTMTGLAGQQGKLTPTLAMQILRTHAVDSQKPYSPDHGLTGAEVCMHAGYGPVRNSQTAGSMVSHLIGDLDTHWLTGTAAPCTSIFKPVWMDAGLPDQGESPQGTYTPGSLWWQHELLHREVLRDFRERLPQYLEERDALEQSFLEEAAARLSASPAERLRFSSDCFSKAAEVSARWRGQVRTLPIVHHLSIPYALAWKNFNKQARLS